MHAYIFITFFTCFAKAFVDKGQVETKMLSALLSGVNRAFNYVQGNKLVTFPLPYIFNVKIISNLIIKDSSYSCQSFL